MTLNQLTYFCMLAKTQSYTQAAQALFIAQPSLSYAISTLEKELGCLLVAREGRRISLTPAGETFYRYAKAALEAIAQGVQAVQCGGVIRLGAIATAMAEHIPKLVVDFRAEHPQTTINVSVAASKDILSQIESGQLDAGLCPSCRGSTRCILNRFTRNRGYSSRRPIIRWPSCAVRLHWMKSRVIPC